MAGVKKSGRSGRSPTRARSAKATKSRTRAVKPKAMAGKSKTKAAKPKARAGKARTKAAKPKAKAGNARTGKAEVSRSTSKAKTEAKVGRAKTAKPGTRAAKPEAKARKAGVGKSTPGAGRPKAKAAGGRAKSARAAPTAARTILKIRELDPHRRCGPGTTVERLIRVDEQVDGRLEAHLVFLDRHGWYCEHGPGCHAVGYARKHKQ